MKLTWTREKTEKGKQFEINRLKENRKTALANLTRQINIISPLLADFESKKQVPTEVEQFDKLLVKMQEAHDMYISCPYDDGEIKLAQQWYKSRDRVCISIKAKYY